MPAFQSVEFFDNNKRDDDMMLFEAENALRIMNQDIGIENKDLAHGRLLHWVCFGHGKILSRKAFAKGMEPARSGRKNWNRWRVRDRLILFSDYPRKKQRTIIEIFGRADLAPSGHAERHPRKRCAAAIFGPFTIRAFLEINVPDCIQRAAEIQHIKTSSFQRYC
jgi:hypothetical protein